MSRQVVSIVFGLLLFACSVPVLRSRSLATPEPSVAVLSSADARGDGPWRHRKPLHQLVGCYAAVLGVGGVLLLFATGPSAAALGVLVIGLAMELCG